MGKPGRSHRWLLAVDWLSCLLWIALAAGAAGRLVKQNGDPWAKSAAAVLSASAILVALYFLRYVWRPLPPDRWIVASQAFLSVLLLLLGALGLIGLLVLCVPPWSGKKLLILPWAAATVGAMIGLVRRMRRGEATPAYQILDARIGAAGFSVGGRASGEGRRMRLSDVPWTVGVLMVLMLAGVLLMALCALAFASRKWASGLIALLAGLPFLLLPFFMLRSMLRALAGKKPAKSRIDWGAFWGRTVFSVRGKVGAHMARQWFAVFFVLAVSLLPAVDSLLKRYVGGFIFSLVVAAVFVFAATDMLLEGLRKERRRKKPELGPEEIRQLERGYVLAAYAYCYLLLIGGLAGMALIGQPAEEAAEAVPGQSLGVRWAGLLSAWLVLCILSRFHRAMARPVFPRGADAPWLVRLTEPLAAALVVVNPLELLAAIRRLRAAKRK